MTDSGKWKKEWRDVGIVRETRTEATYRSSNDSIACMGGSLYPLWEASQIKAACEKFGVTKEELMHALVGHYQRIVGTNLMELVYYFDLNQVKRGTTNEHPE